MTLRRTRMPVGQAGDNGSNGAAGSNFYDYVCVHEQQTAGTAGGTATSASWQTRALTTEQSDTAGLCSLSSNQVTLTAGTYIIRASAPAYRVDGHQTRLRNVTDGTTLVVGSSENSFASGDLAVTRSHIEGTFTVAASKALEIQHRVVTTRATDGYGRAANWDEVEVYTICEFFKVS